MKDRFSFCKTSKCRKDLIIRISIISVFLFCSFLYSGSQEYNKVYALRHNNDALEENVFYSYEYDANGRLIKVRDEKGTLLLEYHYDHLGNILSNGKKSKKLLSPDRIPGTTQDILTDYVDSGQVRDINKQEADRKNTDIRNVDEPNVGILTFDDIKNHWAKNDIEFVLKRGYFKGTSNSVFSPNREMSRAMMVAVLARVERSLKSSSFESGTEGSPVGYGVFKDVDRSSYYANDLNWAFSKEIISGISKERFAPNQNMTREQLSRMLSNYLIFKKVEKPKDRNFTNNIKITDFSDISPWARESVEHMYRFNLLKGKSGGRFDPKSFVTRAEMAVVIKRLVLLLETL